MTIEEIRRACYKFIGSIDSRTLIKLINNDFIEYLEFAEEKVRVKEDFLYPNQFILLADKEVFIKCCEITNRPTDSYLSNAALCYISNEHNFY